MRLWEHSCAAASRLLSVESKDEDPLDRRCVHGILTLIRFGPQLMAAVRTCTYAYEYERFPMCVYEYSDAVRVLRDDVENRGQGVFCWVRRLTFRFLIHTSSNLSPVFVQLSLRDVR